MQCGTTTHGDPINSNSSSGFFLLLLEVLLLLLLRHFLLIHMNHFLRCLAWPGAVALPLLLFSSRFLSIHAKVEHERHTHAFSTLHTTENRSLVCCLQFLRKSSSQNTLYTPNTLAVCSLRPCSSRLSRNSCVRRSMPTSTYVYLCIQYKLDHFCRDYFYQFKFQTLVRHTGWLFCYFSKSANVLSSSSQQ